MSRAASVIAGAVVLGLPSLGQAAIIIDSPKPADDFVSGSSIAGQSFTPGDAIDTSTNTTTTSDSLLLSSFTFLRGNGSTGASTTAAEAANLYLNIYTDGDGRLGATGGDRVLIGSSTNTVDYAEAQQGDTLTFDFDSLELDADTKYFAVFSGNNADGQIEQISVYLGDGNQYGGGSFVEGNNGISEVGSGRDLVFTANFVPEPGSMSLIGIGSILLLGRNNDKR